MLQLLHDILAVLAPWEAWLFAMAALATVAIGALADTRPLTRTRLREGVLTSVIFMMLGVRGIVFAATTPVFPGLVLGENEIGVSLLLVAALLGAGGLVGIACHRAPALWRTVGAGALVAIAIAETAVIDHGLGPALSNQADLIPVYATAFIAVVLALASWSNRAAAPNPLRSDPRPFDY